MKLYDEHGVPRRKLPACMDCGADELGAYFDRAWCHACSWKGDLGETLAIELRSRPARHLLAVLECRDLDPAKFALTVSMGLTLGSAKSNLAAYTRATSRKSPGADLLLRWAAELDLEPGSFYEEIS